MKTLFDMLYAPPPKVMLFGDACNSVTDPIAKASRFFHLIQLSYADTHPMYTTESYPNFFRVVPSESAFNPARLSLIKHFNWTRVGTIYQNAPRYSLPHSKLLTDLDKNGIEIAFTQSIADETDPELQKLKVSIIVCGSPFVSFILSFLEKKASSCLPLMSLLCVFSSGLN